MTMGVNNMAPRVTMDGIFMGATEAFATQGSGDKLSADRTPQWAYKWNRESLFAVLIFLILLL